VKTFWSADRKTSYRTKCCGNPVLAKPLSPDALDQVPRRTLQKNYEASPGGARKYVTSCLVFKTFTSHDYGAALTILKSELGA
jgi:hypothetical protein